MMKRLFLLLIAVNLAFFAWRTYYPDLFAVKTAEKPAPESDAPRLVLLSELPVGSSALSSQAMETEEPESAQTPISSTLPMSEGAPEEAAPELPPPPTETTPVSEADGMEAAVPESEPVTPEPQANQSLTDDQAPPPAVTAPEPLLPAQLCYRIGPYTEKAQAQEAVRRLHAMSVAAGLHTKDVQERIGEWVFLQPYPSREAARKVAEALKAKDIKDFFVVGAKAHENAISLGVFSDPATARRRLSQIRDLGYEPRIDDFFRTRTRYWVDYEVSGEEDELETLWETWRTEHEGLLREKRDCP